MLDMNVYRINPMRTRLSFAMSSSAVLAFLLLVAPSSTAVAAEAEASAVATAAETNTVQAEQTAQGKAAVSSTQAEPAASSDEVAPDPASITEVGVQRLPPSTYPEPYTRGLPYGSLWLTFHGLQWPYMPAARNGGPRFVLGLSGWGWVDTSYEKFAP